jgi:hypothetical protein
VERGERTSKQLAPTAALSGAPQTLAVADLGAGPFEGKLMELVEVERPVEVQLETVVGGDDAAATFEDGDLALVRSQGLGRCECCSRTIVVAQSRVCLDEIPQRSDIRLPVARASESGLRRLELADAHGEPAERDLELPDSALGSPTVIAESQLARELDCLGRGGAAVSVVSARGIDLGQEAEAGAKSGALAQLARQRGRFARGSVGVMPAPSVEVGGSQESKSLREEAERAVLPRALRCT